MFFLTTFGPHHFWPTPLLAKTALCPNLCESSLKILAGLLFGTICCSCLVCWAVVVWCGVSVRCVFKNFMGASKIWALPRLPSAGPLLRLHPRRRTPLRGPPSAGPPKISLFFFPRPPLFSFFLPLLGVVSWNFGGVIEGRDPQMCTFGLSGCRVKPRRLWGGKKKSEILAPHPSGPHPSGPPPFGAPLFLGLGPHPSGPNPSGPSGTLRGTPLRRTALTVSGLLFVLFCSWPPAVNPSPLPPLQCLTFQNVNNNFHNQLRQNLPVSHRISTGRHSSSPPSPLPHHPSGPHTSALIVLGLAPMHSGLLAPVVCCVLPLLTFQNVCTAFVAFLCCFLPLFAVA